MAKEFQFLASLVQMSKTAISGDRQAPPYLHSKVVEFSQALHFLALVQTSADPAAL